MRSRILRESGLLGAAQFARNAEAHLRERVAQLPEAPVAFATYAATSWASWPE
jgi:hypothetical protein